MACAAIAAMNAAELVRNNLSRAPPKTRSERDALKTLRAALRSPSQARCRKIRSKSKLHARVPRSPRGYVCSRHER